MSPEGPPPMPDSRDLPVRGGISFEDFNAITSAVYTFAYALDTRDWALMRTVFADALAVDTSAATGKEPETLPADAFIWDVKVTETGFEGTELLFGNPQAGIDGDTAYLRLAFYGEHIAAIADGNN